MGWVFLTALKANIDSALCDATPVCSVQRHLEELEQRILVLEQEPRGPEEPSKSDSEVVINRTLVGDVIRLQVPAWQRGPLCSRK